ncbi:MAG: NosD domain-containing protein [Candidatus Aenigmatarchaeota archaeon]
MNNKYLTIFLFIILFIFVPKVKAITYISDCARITEPGEYYLTNDIINTSASVCIEFFGVNSVIDCQGHIIDSDGSGNIAIALDPEGSEYVTIRNCIIQDWDVGISSHLSSYNNIYNNTFINNSRAIYLPNSIATYITRNRFFNNSIAIELDSGESIINCKGYEIKGEDYDIGIYSYNSTFSAANCQFIIPFGIYTNLSTVHVVNSIFNGNYYYYGTGIALENSEGSIYDCYFSNLFEAIKLINSNYSNISLNHIQNTVYGIRLIDSNNSEFFGNKIYGTEYASLHLENSYHNNFVFNYLKDSYCNAYAINSSFNNFSLNIFDWNYAHICDGECNNYWSNNIYINPPCSLECNDNNIDGICDEPCHLWLDYYDYSPLKVIYLEDGGTIEKDGYYILNRSINNGINITSGTKVVLDCNFNSISSPDTAIETNGAHFVVKNCIIENSSTGIEACCGSGDIINSIIREDITDRGIVIYTECEYQPYLIYNNTLNNSALFICSLGATLTKNFVAEVGFLDFAEASNSNYVYDNYFRCYGVDGSCYLFEYLNINFLNLWKAIEIVNNEIRYVGGNYWGRPDGTGYSDVCEDSNEDGFCDLPYDLSINQPCTVCSDYTDFLPLKSYIYAPPTPPPPPPPPPPAIPPGVCRPCDYSRLNPSSLVEYFWIGVCLLLNLILCNTIFFALFIILLIFLYLFKEIRKKF